VTSSHTPQVLFAAVLLAAMLADAERPTAADDYFKGKTIRIIAGSEAGGMYDTFGRLVSRHLADHLPGKPTIVVADMPGASGVRATNYLYEVAPKDGTVLATFNKSMPFYQATGEGGIRFKAQEFSWIGALSQTNDTIAVWHTTGVKTIDDAKRREIIMGALSYIGTNWTYPVLLNALIGTKFKIVTGYPSGVAVNHAMEKGEVEGRGSNQWSAWKSIHPDWVKEKKILPLVQVGLRKEADLPDVPLLSELAQDEEQRRMLQFVSEAAAMDGPLAGPPGIPPAALAALRTAFNGMTKDASFRAETEKLRIDLGPLTGEEVEKIVASIVATPRTTVEKVKSIIAPPKESEAGKVAPARGN
jgi:tripartite-type tricarboxylate transporter receptor subunit TctC